MPTDIDALEAEVLGLPPSERSRLLERLIASLDSDPEIEEAWVAEAERREGEISKGTVAAVPGAEAVARLRARLR
jgi:putative addiction module component (TIGR02574 family)